MAKKDAKKCQDIRDKIVAWRDYFKSNDEAYHDSMQFVMGEQWTSREADVLKSYKKPPMTFNKLAPLINHLLGELRLNTPALEVKPITMEVKPEVVSVREALVKSISLHSHAKQAYQQAGQQAFIGGYGALRVQTEYEHDYSFEQTLRIYGVQDPTKCYWDVKALHPCKIDGEHCGYSYSMSRTLFRKKYGKDIEKRIGDMSGLTDRVLFSSDEQVEIIHHYERTRKTKTLYRLSNNAVVDGKELEELEEAYIDFDVNPLMPVNEETEQMADEIEEQLDERAAEEKSYMYQGQVVNVIDNRVIHESRIKEYKIAGDYILESTDFPSESMPVVFVDQNSWHDKNGHQITRSIIKDACDAQKFINYLGTQITYMLKVSRYDQWIGSKKNVASQDTQEKWRDPYTVRGMLTFDESPTGVVPQQTRPPEISQSLTQQYQRALQDIETSTGIYATKMGEQGQETSGAAIWQRSHQSSYNTYVAFDSVNRAIAAVGQVVNEAIPYVYDTERAVSLDLKGEGEKPVVLNQNLDDYSAETVNNMIKGRYNVIIKAGSSFEGQKQQALQSLQMVLQANPQLFQMIADLYAENLPLPNAVELRNRLKTIVPPEIIEAGRTGEQIPPKPQAPNPEMIKMQIEMEKLQLEKQKLEMKAQELQLKAQKEGADVRMEQEKLQVEKLDVAAKLEEQMMRYNAEMHRTMAEKDMAHARNITDILTHK